MVPLYPLRFQPIYRRYLWGGRRLATSLDKPLAEGDDYAESWEVVDRGSDQSIVVAGELAGRTLHSLVDELGPRLLGPIASSACFPLLFKFLDARLDLSVQVHPNDQQAARLSPPDLGKNEAWVILDKQPGSRLFAGLRAGIDRAALERAAACQRIDQCLHVVEPDVGDCLFIPAGTVHALGAGLLVAEIQQASDTTYRLFDWNRTAADGSLRPLHWEQALEVIDFRGGPIDPQSPQRTGRSHVERLVECEKFVLDRWRLVVPETLVAPSQARNPGTAHGFHLLAVLDGSVSVTGDPSGELLSRGQTMLVPAEIVSSVALQPVTPAILLDICLPPP